MPSRDETETGQIIRDLTLQVENLAAELVEVYAREQNLLKRMKSGVSDSDATMIEAQNRELQSQLGALKAQVADLKVENTSLLADLKAQQAAAQGTPEPEPSSSGRRKIWKWKSQ